MVAGKENYVRLRTWLVCLISCVGIYLGITKHSIMIVVFAINILSLFFLNINEIFCELFFLLPFTMIYKLNPASTSLFTYLCIITVGYLVLNGNNKFSRKWIYLIMIYVLYSFVGMGSNITAYIKLISSFFLGMICIRRIERKCFSKIPIFLGSGIIVSSFIGLRKTEWSELGAFFSDLNSEYIAGVKTYRFSALYVDPNYFSILVMVCLMAIIIFMYEKEIKGIVGVSLAVPLIVFGCLTYSKIFYIALAIGLMFVFMIRIKISGKVLSSSFILLFVIIVGYFIADYYGIITNIVARFSAEDISNKRFFIWGNYFEYFRTSWKTLFFGDGIGASYYMEMGPHNFYIELIYFLGIIGAVLYLSICWEMLNLRRCIVKRTFLNYAVLIILLIMFSTLGVLFSNDFIFLLIIVWMSMNVNMINVGKKRCICMKSNEAEL